MHPDKIVSPSATGRGTLSPVNADVSIEVDPFSTTPSIGTFSPFLTTKRSSIETFSGSTSIN